MLSLLIVTGIAALVWSGPAAATGSRVWTADFGITPDVFSTPASTSLPVGASVPVNLVIIDNDSGCVSPTFASCHQPTGTVAITAEDASHHVVTLGTQSLTSVPQQPGRAGEAVFHFPATLAPGSYVVEASYSGDATFSSGGVVGALLLTITKATPTVVLSQSSPMTQPGKPFTVHAAVTYPTTAASGAPLAPETPTGMITLTQVDGSGGSAALPLGADGTAAFTVTGPTTPADLTFTATYSGDTYVLNGSSSALVHHVAAAIATPTPTPTPPASSTSPPASSAPTTESSPPTASAASPSVATSTPGGILAETGVHTTGLLLFASALLISGVGALAASRRTRRAH